MTATVIKANVWEIASVTGTGTVTLPGASAQSGFRTWNAAGVSSGSLVPYKIFDRVNFAWEIGVGIYTITTSPAGTLTRSFIDSSTGSALSFAGNSCDITLVILPPIFASTGSASSGMFAALNANGVFDPSFLSSPITPQSVAWGTTVNFAFTYSTRLYSTATSNATLTNPSSPTVGAEFTWDITQDSTGSRLLAFGSNFVFPNGITPVLSTTAGATDTLTGYVRNDGKILVTPIYSEAV